MVGAWSAQSVGLVVLLGLLLAPSLGRAQDHSAHRETGSTRLIAANVALTGILAVGRRWVEGGIEDEGDVLRTFLYGSAGGYGFYQSKRLIGRGHTRIGTGLAFLSASVVENAAMGRHPLGFVRVGPGPVDLRLRTPLARQEAKSPRVTLEPNALSTLASFVYLVQGEYRPFFSGSLLGFRHTTSVNVAPIRGFADGYTLGRTILVSRVASASTVRHETIHVVQALQLGATTPYYRLSALQPSWDRAIFGSTVSWDVQLDWLYGASFSALLLADYEDRWTEIEAFSLVPPGAGP